MSLTSAGAEPQPSLAWTFESSNVDYMTNRSPVYSTTDTATTYAPTYQMGKYNLGMRLQNNSGTQANTWLRYTFSTSIPIDTGVSISCWVKYTTLTSTQSAVATLYDNITSGFANTMSIGMTTSGTVGYSSGSSFYNSNLVPNSISGTYSAGTWYHLAVTFNSSSIIGYLNGVAATPKTTLTTGLSFAGFRLGTYVNNFNDNSGFSPADCTIDDLRIYRTALSAVQVQSIYNTQGMPSRVVADGPQPKVFLGPLLTYPTATTVSAPTNDGTKITFTRASSQYLDFGSQTFDMTRGFSATCKFAFFGTAVAYERIFDFGKGQGDDNLILCRNYTTQSISFYFQNGATQYFMSSTNSVVQGQVNTVTAIYTHSPVSLTIILNGVTTTSTPAAAATTPRTLTICYVGRSNWVSDPYPNLDIYSLNIYNRALTPSELAGPPAPSPWSILTGTPLFNQISSSAASSAVGAFSLRAVNGVTAKAVQVRPVAAFPPVAMTSAAVQATNQFTQTLTGYPFGGAGSYTSNCSSFYPSLFPWRAFDKTNAEWASGAGADYSAGVATTNTQTSGIYNGAWLQIQNPVAINLFSYSITSPPNWSIKSPAKWYILGSNDGTTWTLVDSQQTAVTWTSVFQVKTFVPTPTIAYSYYRIVVNEINGTAPGGGLVEISELNLFGAPPNTATDFYADERGNLLTSPVVGTSLQNWLGGATGYVTTWYDQSGTNHATQTTAANQPIIQRATKGPGYMVNFNGTSQFVTLSADSQFLNGTNITVNAVALRTATKTTQNWFFGTNTPSVNYQRFQFGFQSDTIISMNVTSGPTDVTIPAYNASNEPVYYMTGGLIPSRVFYQNDTLGGTNSNPGLMSAPTGYSYSIGNGNQGGVYYYQGNLFELLIFTSALDQTQVTQVYQNQLGAYGT